MKMKKDGLLAIDFVQVLAASPTRSLAIFAIRISGSNPKN